jgi:hypothetical protein
MLKRIKHLLNPLGELKGLAIRDFSDPLRLKLPDRPQRRVGMDEYVVLAIVPSERQELVKELFILEQPFSC